MKINRHNYEEYFMLYSDNELSEDDRNMVQSFILKNPDLEEELNSLLLSILVADNNIIFENKNILLKSNEEYGINIHTGNVQEWLVLYTDDELTSTERSSVENFIADHPDIKEELDFFRKARLQPDPEITFPGKELLYKREERVRLIPVRWWRIAAAAVLILAAGLTAIVLFNKPVSPLSEGVPVVQSQQPATKENPVVASSKETTQINMKVTETPAPQLSKSVRKQAIPVPAIQHDKKNPQQIINKEEKNLVAGNPILTNNLPVPESGMLRPENLTAVTHVIENRKSPGSQNKPDFPVTTQVADTYHTYTSTNPKATNDALYAVDMGENKNKLRGIFRKVTRIFEKNTQINATDENDRLLIGGLSVKLK